MHALTRRSVNRVLPCVECIVVEAADVLITCNGLLVRRSSLSSAV
ncbi:hypothetical protein [Modestobacter sp. NPDC049651]